MGDKSMVSINLGDKGSTGKIMISISKLASLKGYDAWIAYPPSRDNSIRYDKTIIIGNFIINGIERRLCAFTGFQDRLFVVSTAKLISKLKKIKPVLIHLHNLHSGYINLPMLFSYIKKYNIPVVWTLHDCWAFTGQCPYFTMVKCDKWKTGCYECPQYRLYPQSHIDRTKKMWKLKKKWFTGVKNMTIVTPSQWLADLVKESFLSAYPVKVINNGIDLNVFKPTENDFREVYGLQNKKIILGVAFGWGDRKGYGDCLKLAKLLGDDYHLVLVGVSKAQIAALPKNVLGIERTDSQKEMAEIYSAADVFINTTYEDNYPTVNLEACACGLPIITYNTGGSPESAGTDAVVVEVGDIQAMREAIETTVQVKKQRPRVNEISSDAKFAEYIELYSSANAGRGHSLLEKNTVV